MKSTILLILPIAAFFLLLSSGCSVLGYGLGSALDKSGEATYVPDAPASVLELSHGDPIRIQDEGTAPREVTFLRLMVPKEEEILARVEDRQQEAASEFAINPGDRVRYKETGEDEREVVFVGCSTTHFWYHEAGVEQLKKCSFSRLQRIRSGSHTYRESFLRAVYDGHLAAVYDVVILDGGMQRRIPLQQLGAVWTVSYPVTGRALLTGVGAAADLVIVAAVASASMSRSNGGLDAMVKVLNVIAGGEP